MTVEEVNELLGKYVNLAMKASLAKTDSDKLQEEAAIAKDLLQASLYKLFRENSIYHCPDCGGIMSLQSKRQKVDDLYYLWCSSCKTKSRWYLDDLETLLGWKNQCEQREKERKEWENKPMKEFRFFGNVRFATEWIVKARDATEARMILRDKGLNFDKEHWRENPADNIKRTFLYPWLSLADDQFSDTIPEELGKE